MRNVSDKRCREHQIAHFIFNISFLTKYCARQATDELNVKYSADKMRFAWREIKARMQAYAHTHTHTIMFNLLTPNVNYSGRTAPLTSKVAFYIFIQQI